EQKERLGKGSFGVVRHIIEISTSRHLACKEMDYEEEYEKLNVEREKDQILKATRILRQSPTTRSLTQLPIVELLGFFVSEDGRKAYLVMEYCSGGDLRKYINNMKKMGVAINPDVTLDWPDNFKQVENTQLITEVLFCIKVLNFIELQEQMETIQLAVKEEFLKDIWSFGVMMFELLAQRHPFFDNKQTGGEIVSAFEFMRRVTTEEPAALPSNYPESLKNLIKQMLNKNPERRIAAEAILQLPEVSAILKTN
ncbi:MAG: hypothetical protein EZS28_040263, partial [Streblomastix strix]